jgi:hypothetical protein
MNNIKEMSEKLLSNRGITNHTAAERFKMDFVAYLFYFSNGNIKDAEEAINLLSDSNNLTCNSIFNTNFRLKLDDIISTRLKSNKIFMNLFNVLIQNKGKGIGEGELILPLIIKNYKFSNTSDGVFSVGQNKYNVEIKKSGASLKPVKTGLTQKGLVDILNNKYFNGTVPGKTSKKLFEKHLASISNPKDYELYFHELYVGCDNNNISDLCNEVVNNKAYQDPILFNNALGKFALKEYKKIDGWNNIVFIDVEKRNIVNVHNISNISNLNIKFKPVMRRGKDTQAISDGYVNAKI